MAGCINQVDAKKLQDDIILVLGEIRKAFYYFLKSVDFEINVLYVFMLQLSNKYSQIVQQT